MKATTRFALLAAMLVVIPAMIVGVILYQANRAHMVAEEQARMAFAMHQAAKDLRDAATDARAKVDFLAGTPPVAILPRLRIEGAADPSDVRAQQKVWKDRLTQIFLALAKTSPDIMQIRLIEAAHDGQELVRVNRDGASVVAIPEADLQQKGDQPYAVQTLAAPPGDVLMFDINLNREHGQIEVPHVPVLRVSTPIYGPSGTAYGLIVINVDMRGVFARMRSHFLSGVNFYLANAGATIWSIPIPARPSRSNLAMLPGSIPIFPNLNPSSKVPNPLPNGPPTRAMARAWCNWPGSASIPPARTIFTWAPP